MYDIYVRACVCIGLRTILTWYAILYVGAFFRYSTGESGIIVQLWGTYMKVCIKFRHLGSLKRYFKHFASQTLLKIENDVSYVIHGLWSVQQHLFVT